MPNVVGWCINHKDTSLAANQTVVVTFDDVVIPRAFGSYTSGTN